MARTCGPRVDSSDFFVESDLEIVAFEPPHRLVSRSDGRVRSLATWSLAPADSGTTVSFVGDYTLPLALRVVGERAIERMLSAQIRQSIANLARLFEQPAAP